MICLYELIPQKDPYASLKHMLLEIRDSYKFDIIKAISFSHNGNYPYVRIKCEKNRRVNQIEYNYMLNIVDIDKSFLGLMCKEKKIIFYNYNKKKDIQKFYPLNKNAKTEIYYPLFDSENKVFACLYLCSIKEVKV